MWKWSTNIGFTCLRFPSFYPFSAALTFSLLCFPVDFKCNHNKLWKILQEMGIPDHLTCFLRNLYAGQEATVRTGHGTTDWFQIRKGVPQGCILLPCLFNLYAEYIMRNTGLEEAQAESRLQGEISITSDMQMTPPLWQKVKRNSKASWWKWKRRVKKLASSSTFRKWRSWHLVPLLHGNRCGNSGNSVRLYFLGL